MYISRKFPHRIPREILKTHSSIDILGKTGDHVSERNRVEELENLSISEKSNKSLIQRGG